MLSGRVRILSDVLSQSEIDALLNAIGSGGMDSIDLAEEESAVKVREYDFRTANRFHKEQIRTLNVIYDTFARLFSTYLSGTLRVMCNAEVVSVEELKYQEFVNSLPEPVLLAVLRQPPLSGPVLLEISPDVSYAMISRLLGGVPAHSNSRSFTEIELVLLERILRQFLPIFAESWEKIIGITTTLERIETSPQFAQIVALNETVAIITIDVQIGAVNGLLNLCLPHLAIEPVNNQLSTKFIYQSGVENRYAEPAMEDIKMRIRRTPLEVKAVFSDTNASVRDVLNLQVGDVLQLDHLIAEPLTVMVGHLPKFRAAMGVKDKRYAVKVTDIIRKEEEE